VAEYNFEMEAAAGRDAGTEWRIIDVGGSRSQVRSAFDMLHSLLNMTISMSVSEVSSGPQFALMIDAELLGTLSNLGTILR
jgi:hypothetical protein